MVTEDNTTCSNNSISNMPPEECICWSVVTSSAAMSTFHKVMLSAVMVPYMAVGLPANLWVVWLIARANEDLLAAEFFLLNLALSDTLYILAIPLCLFCVYDPSGSGPSVMVLVMEFWMFIWIGRPLFQCCICFERYLAVVRPLTFIRFKPLRFRVAISGVMWVAVMTNMASIWTMTISEVYSLSSSPVMFLPIILFFCLSVLWSLKQPGPIETGGDQMKRRAFDIILLNLGILLLNHLPLVLISPLNGIVPTFDFLLHFFLYVSVLCGIVQPLCYLYKARKLTCS